MIRRVRTFADTGNLVRFGLSLVLAFALWAWVTNENDPEQTYIANNVQVEIRQKAPSLEIVSPLDVVEIRIQAPRSVIQTLDPSRIVAWVSLDDRTGPGTATEKVGVDVPRGVRTARVTPTEIPVALDTLVSQTFPVKLLSPNDLPRNLEVTKSNVDIDTVTVTGVQRNVERVAQVIVPVAIGGRTTSFTAKVTPQAVDENNMPIDSITLTPSTVTLSVDLATRGKEIPVFVQCGCTAAPGFQVLGYPQASPSTVLLDGPSDALAQIQYIYTTPIDTGGLTATTVLNDIQIETSSLPKGVTIDPSVVSVLVQVSQQVSTRTFEDIPIQVLNRPPGATVTVSPPTASLTVEGPQEEIAALTGSEISIVVDVGGLGAGVRDIRPRAILPPRVQYADAPQQVTVTIVLPPPPTPTATVAP
ncbi:MAG TPA: CdaR family protein [Thermomicrobiales bacterium]|nr:CdaR family protein [Thermomicrobiales bacterium]